jgi:polysaccharide chain length determinant protein (PEP-CTERM system associated)
MSTEYQLTFNDYLSILRRRGLLLAATFFGLLAVALVVVVAIPPVYQSTGTIMVESQTIPADLIAASAASMVDERIEIIRQRVMTRENLFKIIEKHGLFKDSTQSMTVSDKIDEMRKQISVESIGANLKSSRRQGQGTIAFRLAFEHRKPEITQRVASELVTLFLDENVKSRTERATETTEFLTQEADKLKVELEKVETQLAAYKQEHSKALPQHQELHMGMLSRTETELKDVEREYKAAQEELRFLDLELSAAKAGITPKTGAAYSAQNPQDIGSLKAEYQRLLSQYTEAHPDVRAVKRKIEALEAAAPAPASAGAEKPAVVPPVSLEVARVQTKIAATNTRIESLAGQIKTLRGRMGSYEQQLLQTPQVERGLITLMRDHESAQKKYEEIHAKQRNAKIAENLEGENKAERFSLLEPPSYPDKPSKPDRVKILLIGIFAAFGGAGGLVFLLETLNHRIRGQEALAIAIRQRPMMVIPYIVIEDEVRGRKRLLTRVAIVAAAVIVIAALLLHFAYMPLDILLMKIIARFG